MSRELHTIFGEEANIEFISPSTGLEADRASPLFDVITAVLKEHGPEATAVPTLLTGATDAKHIARLGTKVYGFAPEPYTLASMRWGTRVLYEVVARFAGKE